MTPNLRNIGLTDHAVLRAMERYNCKNKVDALNFCKQQLEKATYIGKTFCEKGNPSYMFTHNNIAIYLSENLATVITIFKIEESADYKPLEDKITEMHLKEFRKMVRLEQMKQSKLSNLKLEYDVELSQLKLKMHRTRSEQLKQTCQVKINEITLSIKNYESEIFAIQSSIRQLSKIIAYRNIAS